MVTLLCPRKVYGYRRHSCFTARSPGFYGCIEIGLVHISVSSAHESVGLVMVMYSMGASVASICPASVE